MSDLTNFDIYKITNSPTEGYIFSVIELNENEEEPNFRYYILTINNEKPTIKRLNNTIGILNSELLTLEKIEPTSEEITRFIQIISRLTISRQKINEEQTTFVSNLEESDIALFKNKAL